LYQQTSALARVENPRNGTGLPAAGDLMQELNEGEEAADVQSETADAEI